MAVAYDGSCFHGWQMQHNATTVQGKIEGALEAILHKPVRVHGSGRTDAGVHALNQIAHCDLPKAQDLHKLRGGLNALAAPAVAVKKIVEVPAAFHARHSAVGKTYRYHIYNRAYPPVLAPRRCWWVKAPLDDEAMRLAAEQLLGTQDFSSFRAAECTAKSPIRTLSRIELAIGNWPDGTLMIEMEASGFLQHMARIVTGTLVAVGLGRLAPEALPAILAARRREAAAATAPGHGLHLVRVAYDLDIYPQLRALKD